MLSVFWTSTQAPWEPCIFGMHLCFNILAGLEFNTLWLNDLVLTPRCQRQGVYSSPHGSVLFDQQISNKNATHQYNMLDRYAYTFTGHSVRYNYDIVGILLTLKNRLIYHGIDTVQQDVRSIPYLIVLTSNYLPSILLLQLKWTYWTMSRFFSLLFFKLKHQFSNLTGMSVNVVFGSFTFHCALRGGTLRNSGVTSGCLYCCCFSVISNPFPQSPHTSDITKGFLSAHLLLIGCFLFFRPLFLILRST